MSDESTSNAKKSRSLSDAERRLIRRQKRILNNANGRLERITSTHSSSPLATDDTDPQKLFHNENVSSSTLDDKLFHNDHENPPVSSSTLDDKLFHKDHENSPVPSSTLGEKLFHKDHENPPVSSSTLDDDNDGFFVNNELSRRKLTNLDPANSSSVSLASISPEDLTIYDEINNYYQQHQQQQQQQQNIQPFPFLPFLNPDLINPAPPAQQQLDVQSKLWQLIHFFAMIMLGLLVTWFEVLRRDGSWSRVTKFIYRNPNEISDTDRVSNWPLFWYFITIELILQSSRLFIQKGRTFGGTTLGAIAASLPPPLSDALTLLMRYNLIWNSLWEDICVLAFVIGFYIMISPILSIFW